MGGKLFLSGGGDEKQTFEVDEIFLKSINKILYIPLAWKNDDFESCLKWFRNAMLQHKKVKLKMLTNLTKKITLKDYDAIYIGGGNTFKLLKKIRESEFDKELLDYYDDGGIIYGGSAGAIIFGRDIRTALMCKDADVNEVNLKDTRGFNLAANFDIQCHFEDNQLKEHKDVVNKTNFNIIAIPEESALLIENGQLKAVGPKPLTIITKKRVRKVKNDEIL